ncbi:hypothetical protein PB2503_06807 [Parvularcula bermudensis HTCC2503]|uniref:Acyltransferase 3 domain-containing protein n=1 Tax=Parvularcula bermudensis (strain ATCC BAA-594 / HTCC2503 / KCTC 12087) TaxID=314260 RepID=E0TI88_PARBH|nr:acyltransferase [Parvularcula bermudensis]ADM09427.1 hypothetical protein PB2503_06807 [Parvularcula bermudensis HTCC2503]
MTSGQGAHSDLTRREEGVDAGRLLAAIGVIAIHVGAYDELPYGAGELIRAFCRWCVPFFFIASGYFLVGRDGELRISLKGLSRLVRIFALSCVLFLPLHFLRYVETPIEGVGVEFLLLGTNYHLWFLSSLIMAQLFLAAYDRVEGGLISGVAVLILLGFVIVSYLAIEAPEFRKAEVIMRQLSGVSFVWIGVLIGRRRETLRLGRWLLTLTAALLVLTAIESWVLGRMHPPFADAELLATSCLLAPCLFLLAIRYGHRTPEWLSKMGREQSLLIYLLHPIVIVMAWKAITTGIIPRSSLLIYGITVVVLIPAIDIMRRKLGVIYRALMGGPIRSLDG